MRVGVVLGWSAVLLFIDLVPSEDARLVCALGASVLAGALLGRPWAVLAPVGFAAAVLLFGAVADPSQDAALGWWDWDDGELFLETGYFGLLVSFFLSAVLVAGAIGVGLGANRLMRRFTRSRSRRAEGTR